MAAFLQLSFKAPKKLLRIILHNILQQQEIQFQKSLPNPDPNATSAERPFQLAINDIALKQIRQRSRLIYISALPHQLAHFYQTEASSLATRWVECISIYKAELIARLNPSLWEARTMTEILQGLELEATTSGFLQFEFHDRAIAQWLSHLIDQSFICKPNQTLLNQTEFNQPEFKSLNIEKRIFTLQHSHARCCSLLQLAHQGKLVDCEMNENIQASLSLLSNFLVKKQNLWITDEHHLYTSLLAERSLIGQLVTMLDEWAEPSPDHTKRLLSFGEAISQAFQEVHQTIQLFGQLAIDSRDRLQAHLALLLVTQRVLHQILSCLGYAAPFEL